MTIDRLKSREAKIILVLASVAGVVVGCLYPNAQGFQGLVTLYDHDVVLPVDVPVSARSLQNTTGSSFSFPPPTLVFERLEDIVDVSDVSGGLLHVNVTKEGHVIRTETLLPWVPEKRASNKILLVHEEYRLGYSEPDIV